MKNENKIIRFNNFIRNKRLRIFISLLAIGHGIIRIMEDTTFTSASFGTDILFGTLLIILGILFGLTSISVLRYSILGHIITALLASLYAALGFAMISKNIGSAFTVFMIVIFLLVEEIFIYEH